MKVLVIRAGADKLAEQAAVQLAKLRGNAELRLVLVMRRQQYAEVIITHIGGEVVPDNAADARVLCVIRDVCFQYLDRREAFAIAFNVDVDGNDFKLDRITIAIGVIPMRQGIETIVNHRQRIT